VLAVDFGALGLAVGAIGAADVGAFVPSDAEPTERVEDLLLRGGDEAGTVGVFDAEDEFSATLMSVDVVDEADVGCAYVGVASRRGSDADSDGSFCGADAIRHKGQELMLAEGTDGLSCRCKIGAYQNLWMGLAIDSFGHSPGFGYR
jgi:hypothetical protein